MLLFVFALLLWLPCGMTAPQALPSSSSSPPASPRTAQLQDAPASQPQEASSDSTALLREGTAVKLKLLHTLNSKVVTPGDPLNFSLAQDLVIDDRTLVRAGAAALGHVRQAKPARTLGRGAQLTLQFEYLKAGKTRVPLRGTEARTGEDKKGDTAALVVLFGVSGLVKHGSEIEIKEGSIFSAFVDADTRISLPSSAAAERDP